VIALADQNVRRVGDEVAKFKLGQSLNAPLIVYLITSESTRTDGLLISINGRPGMAGGLDVRLASIFVQTREDPTPS